MNWRFCLISE